PFSKNVTVEDGQTASTSGIYVALGPAPGDVNGDGQVTPADLRIIRAIMGACIGNPRYIPAADMDNSGCINTVDINLWYKAYAAFQAGQN
ncbi:MAG: dockerin type I repeat-containing protein, partial [Desulfatibacillaceae bacterium]|nr:dockerin type I repeat-containing protein [Desulfatibacillaceae bacterium]